MQVQKVILPNREPRYLLLDDDNRIIQPVKRYLKHLDHLGRSIYTLKTYCHHLKLYFTFLDERGLTYLSLPEKGHRVLLLSDFIGWLKAWQGKNVVGLKARRSSRTINGIMCTVIGFYRCLAFNGELQGLDFLLPTAGNRPSYGLLAEMRGYRTGHRSFFRLKERQKEPETASREDIMKMVNACTFLRDKLLILMMYEAGLRLGEALNLWVKDFIPWKNQVKVVQHKGANPMARVKNCSEGILDIPAYVMQLFCRYISEEYAGKDYTYVFVNLTGRHRGAPLLADTVEMKFRQLRKVCDVNIHPHVLRHSHATELIEVGDWDVLDVKTRLRHKHVQTTIQAYIRLSDSYKREKFREFYRKVKAHEKHLDS